MKKKIELCFCDYCNKVDTKHISKYKCRVCEKDCCEDCFKVDSYYTTTHMNGVINPIICKHCWETTKYTIDGTFIAPGGNNDYRNSGSGTAIKLGAFVRTIHDRIGKETESIVEDIFYKHMKICYENIKDKSEKERLIKAAQDEYEKKLLEISNQA